MTNNNEKNPLSEDQGQDLRLKMHSFYANEAQHQRTMMWETVKWFSPILTAIHAAWFYLYRDKYDPNWLILIALSGLIITLICFKLLHTFYRTNLIFLSMLIKTEDDLNFKNRLNRNYFPRDELITHNTYLEDRLTYPDAITYVNTELKKGTMHQSMRYVFFLFLVGFCFEIFISFWKIYGGNTMVLWTNVISVIIGLIGGLCLAFALKIKTQYSKELIRELKLDEDIYIIPTSISQREGLFWWGIGLITAAALIQIYLLISKACF